MRGINALNRDDKGAMGKKWIQVASAKTALATVGAGTLTADLLLSGLIMRTGPIGAYNETTPTAAQIVAAMGEGVEIGDSFDFTHVNGVAYAATMVAGTGVTLAGTTANAASKVRSYRCTVTAVGATPTVTITGIGEMVA